MKKMELVWFGVIAGIIGILIFLLVKARAKLKPEPVTTASYDFNPPEFSTLG